MPEDGHCLRMITLLLDLMRSEGLPTPIYGGAWCAIGCTIMGRPAVAALALEGGIMDLVVPHLRACGSPADWMVRRMVSAAEPYACCCTRSRAPLTDHVSCHAL